jgi:hypothetical protein
MKVLIACEFSGTVRDAFIRKGHYAMSVDYLPCERDKDNFLCADGEKHNLITHMQGDVLDIINSEERWDLMIAFPPCTYLCSSGLHWNKRKPDRAKKTEEALVFIRKLLEAPIEKIALENPVGCISTRIRKYDQKIQPWQFGHDASKRTCLWLKNLPRLKPTRIIPPKGWKLANDEQFVKYKKVDGFLFGTNDSSCGKPIWGNQTPSGQNNLGPSEDRWKLRSKTYEGIAEAMANQWGEHDR